MIIMQIKFFFKGPHDSLGKKVLGYFGNLALSGKISLKSLINIRTFYLTPEGLDTASLEVPQTDQNGSSTLHLLSLH